MALNQTRVLVTADALAQIASETTELMTRLRKVVAYNSHQAIDWAAGDTPAYIGEDEDGNIAGRSYSRQQVANAVGSLAMLSDALSDAHLGNLNQIGRPLSSK